MASTRTADVVIAGAGPAGLATALFLLRQRPQLAGSIIALEKASHPRFKVCAGGLIPKTITALRELGLELGVPAIEVRSGAARTEAGTIELRDRGEALCTIIRRDQFDAWLAHAAREAGLEIVENTRVLGVEQDQDAARVLSDRGVYEGAVVIGADGSGSRVRTALYGRDKENVGRALMIDVAVDSTRAEEFVNGRYRFDFNCVTAGIRGYSWSFPCLIDSRPHLNVGIYDQCPRARVDTRNGKATLFAALKAAFPQAVSSTSDRLPHAYKAFPIRWYDAAHQFACGRTILVGDAAGVDPLMGEGISCAFEHGKLAAYFVSRFLAGDKSALGNYDRKLHRGATGRKLKRLAFAARRFYGPRHGFYFRIARLSRHAQELGIDWYNGARSMDEISAPWMVAKWMRAVLSDRKVR